MARIARVVVPGLPHHVTQRGNRREPVFFGAEDYRLYRRLIATYLVAGGPRINRPWGGAVSGRRPGCRIVPPACEPPPRRPVVQKKTTLGVVQVTLYN